MKVKISDSMDTIPTGNYQGYYWCSGAKNPEMVNGAFDPKLDDNSLYIQEAMLWDASQKISVMIQFTHRPLITIYDLSDVENSAIAAESISYVGHRVIGKSKFRFYQHWQEEDDTFCDGMPVLKMKAQVFIGFE